MEVSDQSIRRWVKAGELKAYKPKKEYRIAESDLQEFLEGRAVPLVQAPLPKLEERRGQDQTPTQTVEEFQQALARVLEPVRTEALREQQAANRALASEGRPQSHIGDPPEAAAADRFLKEFSADERPLAFGEVALGYARFERENTTLREALEKAREQIAQLERENATLRERVGSASA